MDISRSISRFSIELFTLIQFLINIILINNQVYDENQLIFYLSFTNKN